MQTRYLKTQTRGAAAFELGAIYHTHSASGASSEQSELGTFYRSTEPSWDVSDTEKNQLRTTKTRLYAWPF